MSESIRSPAPTSEAVLRRLEWTVIRRLDGVLHGDYRTLLRGYGPDLADLPEDVRAEIEQELADEHELIAGGLDKAKALGVVDEVIEPSVTRSALAAAIVAAAPLRGRHGNIPL